MDGGIFLVDQDENLTRMELQPYQSEALLQRLIAQYPEVLAGDQIDANTPRRWLLVKQEMGIPAEEHGSNQSRFSWPPVPMGLIRRADRPLQEPAQFVADVIVKCLGAD